MTKANLAPVYEGRLAMTNRNSVHVTSDDGQTFQATIYSAINAKENPALVQDLKTGILNRVTDSSTNAVYTLAVPVVIHDPERRIFALVLPDCLRHQEFEYRQKLLQQIESDDARAPAYVRGFQVIFSVDALEALQTLAEPPAVPEAPSQRHVTDSEIMDIESIREELDQQRTRLHEEREQLDALRQRFDRERAQMDEIEERLNRERQELSQAQQALFEARREIDIQKLMAEERALKQATGETSAAEEATQIVTDDQFLEVLADEDEETPASADETFEAEIPEEATGLGDIESEVSEIVDDGIEVFEPEHTLINPLTTGLPARFNDFKVLSERVIEVRDSVVVAAAKLPREDIEALFRDQTEFFVQLHMVDDYPVIGLCIAALDSKGACLSSIGWALDIKGIQHGKVLNRLEESVSLRAGLYDLNGTLLRAVEIKAPLRSNLAWIRAEAKNRVVSATGSFEKAARSYTNASFSRVGPMRHSFSIGSFDELEVPSEIKLAAGIVGFWSMPERVDYLIANRSFCWSEFQKIQEHVVKAAVESGLFINDALREAAVELGLAQDESELCEVMTANFAEVCIGLRPNDLDAMSQWENWDALLGLGEELGIPPDSDVVELAEISLKRAQELAELDEAKAQQGPPTPPVERTLIVAHRSENTGVTYFLPEDAVLDSFNDMDTMEQADLELLLDDERGRIEAAQVLVDRFGDGVVATVLEHSAKMSPQEVAALARFMETKAGSLEGELVRCLELKEPNAVYVAAYALSGIRSASAIPALVDVLSDASRYGDLHRLVDTLAQYGERIVPALSRAIKRDGIQEPFTQLLASLETVHPGTLSNLSKDRSKVLRDSARMARDLRE